MKKKHDNFQKEKTKKYKPAETNSFKKKNHESAQKPSGLSTLQMFFINISTGIENNPTWRNLE